jgi:hypothetical protein
MIAQIKYCYIALSFCVSYQLRTKNVKRKQRPHREKAEVFEWFNLCNSSDASLACLHDLPENSLACLFDFPNVEIKSIALLEGSIGSSLHRRISVSTSGFSLLNSALTISFLGSISAVLRSCSSLGSVNLKVLLHHTASNLNVIYFSEVNVLGDETIVVVKSKLLVIFNNNFKYLLFHHYA